MKTLVKRTSVLLMAAMAIVAGTSAARGDEAVTATVPFAFQVGARQMPAGAYVVSRKVEQPNVITIAASTGERASMALGQPVTSDPAGAQPRLEFRYAGGVYYLAGVVLAYADGHQVTLSTTNPAVPRSR